MPTNWVSGLVEILRIFAWLCSLTVIVLTVRQQNLLKQEIGMSRYGYDQKFGVLSVQSSLEIREYSAQLIEPNEAAWNSKDEVELLKTMIKYNYAVNIRQFYS